MKNYINSHKNFIRKVIELDYTKKFVYTASASNVIGPIPSEDIYDNPLKFVEKQTKPNEKCKLLSELALWNMVTKY
jgi:nucleoside-diphosphate-sugar epimerase